jgi:hypothetical protein
MAARAIPSGFTARPRLSLWTQMPRADLKRCLGESLAMQKPVERSRLLFAEPPQSGWARFQAIMRDARGDPPERTGVESYIRGRLSTRHMTLQVTKRLGRAAFGNSFAPVLAAGFQDEGGGTRITGRFRMGLAVQVFCALWAAGVLAFEVVLAFAATGGGRDIAVGWLLIGPSFLLFLFGLVRSGAWLARRDEAYIVKFLRSSLDGCADARK